MTRWNMRSLGRLPPGREAEATVRVMVSLARSGAVDPRVLEWARAGALAGRCRPADDPCRGRALRRWLARTGRYVPDPVPAELLTAPGELAAQWMRGGYFVGDCDDFAVLAAAGALAVGLVPRFVVLDFPPLPGGHVLAEVFNGRDWEEWDPTFPGAGRRHRGRRREFDV